MKKIVSMLLVVAMIASAMVGAGCSLNKKEAEPDMSQAVVEIGDEVVTMAEYKAMFDMYKSYYSSNMGMDFSTDTEMLKNLQDFVIDMLVGDKVITYQAKTQGFAELTDEQRVELDKTVKENIASMLEYYEKKAQEEYVADPTIDVDARVKELVKDEAVYYTGAEMEYDEYIEWLTKNTENNYYFEQLQNSVNKTITVSDDDVNTWYTENLATMETKYKDDPGAYKDDQEYYEMYAGDPVLYAPDGYSRILHILLAPEGEMPAEYNTKQTQMNGLEGEYGSLAFDDATNGTNANQARMKEILDQYNTAKAELEAMTDARLVNSKKKAEEAYAKLATADFKAVMAEYTQDVDYTDFDVFMEKGMLISSEYESSTDWSDEIKAEFAKLDVGGHSGVFKDDDGYHIIFYLADETAGARDIEKVKEDIKKSLLTQKQTTEWDTLVDGWKKDSAVVTNEELVRSVS
ncbi:MAG: SurA N-terminal domain-containing protein [Clostridia bacterium]